ncbi:hypothetical protein L3D22_11430 [Lysobacter soli]|uniref:DUF6973 domain-containing protein n=1 Tax=Lysobacter soli TaxID=453783 RepID=UPI001F29D794|nr:hypothetical protein [Lysobacter soli]UTA56022.1 hypothetical protein L3D22_11430 [Lysobacter soli]
MFVVAVVLGAYPAFVMVATYSQFFAAGLPGGRNGPADAYRHSLASAIVAYTSSPRCVDLVTAVMERGGQGNAARAMDAHNNRLGARIGAAADSWTAMQQAVLAAVNEGAIDARSPDQITWLAPDAWQERLY